MADPLHTIQAIRRGEAGYEEARERVTWNKRLDKARSPDAIVVCRSAQDVAAAVRIAAGRGLRISPRGGGHHYQAAALRDGGLLLDLSGIDFVEIDSERRIARVGAGIEGGKLAEALAARGFAFPVGHCVDVGLSGYMIAGGFGWNAGQWGAACANLVAVEAVTAAGEIVTADRQRHPSLFWAAQGAGAGFFAAVTAFHLRLHPLPSTAWVRRMTFKADSAPLLADWLTAAMAAASPGAELGCFVMNHWDSGEPAVVLRVSACGESEEDARERVSSFASPPPEAECIDAPREEALPFTDLFRLSPMPAGKRVAADHVWSDAPVGDLLRAVHAIRSPSPASTVDIVAFGGHSHVALPRDGALSVVGGTGAGIYAIWEDPADDEANIAWVRRVDDALAPLRCGRYVGEADLTCAPGRRAECFAPGVPERLDRLRAQYDPDRRFFAWPEP